MRPKITLSTITANRRHFFTNLIRNIQQQELSGFQVEWIIVEDGDETVEDLVRDIEFAQYFRLDGKNSIGTKRNFANSVSSGDYILFFDDDNYAFPHRTKAAVGALLEETDYLIAGSTDMLVLDGRSWSIFQVGPYSEWHATLGTWCIKRELLAHTSFDSNDHIGEEMHFTKNWTIPILQLGALNTSISYSHGANTVSKANLKAPWMPLWTPETFIHCNQTLAFYKSTH